MFVAEANTDAARLAVIESDVGREVRTFREIGLVLALSIAEPTDL